jgi:hypothetical protein
MMKILEMDRDVLKKLMKRLYDKNVIIMVENLKVGDVIYLEKRVKAFRESRFGPRVIQKGYPETRKDFRIKILLKITQAPKRPKKRLLERTLHQLCMLEKLGNTI